VVKAHNKDVAKPLLEESGLTYALTEILRSPSVASGWEVVVVIRDVILAVIGARHFVLPREPHNAAKSPGMDF